MGAYALWQLALKRSVCEFKKKNSDHPADPEVSEIFLYKIIVNCYDLNLKLISPVKSDEAFSVLKIRTWILKNKSVLDVRRISFVTFPFWAYIHI